MNQTPNPHNTAQSSSLNWEDIQWQIPAASQPNHPLELIKNCLDASATSNSTSNANTDLDPYDQIDKQFNIYMESLKKRFKELSR